MEATTWLGIWGLIFQVLSQFPRNRAELTQKHEEALIALSDAYHTTRRYYSHLETGERQREVEWEIADRWYRAAVLLRKYDPELSRRLRRKSEFWHDGGTWSEEEIREAGIGLERVWEEVSALQGGSAMPQ